MLLTPGLKPVDPAFESWWVRPGGATRVRVRPDDRLTVIDPDGGQLAELIVLERRPAALGTPPDAPATVLADRGLAAEDARAIRLFGPDGPPGARQELTARSEADVIVAAPGGRVVDGDWPASALVVELQRAVPRPREEVELPAPLAEPRLDFRVDKASALSYEVREGEYIQIIDVAGRQCSDFLAFHAHKLDAGVERGLDPQVTRTLMGTRVPDGRPALEVLRRRHGPALPGRAGHGRAPRLVRARLHGALLRGPRLPRPRQLHGELQPPARRPTGSRRARAGRRSTSSTTRRSTRTSCCSPTSRGRARATSCCCARCRTSSARRRPARTTSTRPTAGRSPTSTSASTHRRTASRWPSPTASPRRPSPC